MANTEKPNNVLNFRQRIQNQNSDTVRQDEETARENIESERQYQYALAEDRASRKEDRDVEQLTYQIHPPSILRYYTGFFLSIAGDLLDIVAFILLLVFGIGLPIGWIIDTIIDVPLLLLGFKSSKELKKMGSAVTAVTEKITNIEQRVVQYRQRYAMLLRASRKIGALRKPVRQFARKVKKIRKIVTKGPLGRLVVAIIADLLPGLDLIPFRIIAMWHMFKQEKKAYKEFRLTIEEDYLVARAEEAEANNEMLDAEADIQLEKAESDSEYEEMRAQQEADELPPAKEFEESLAA